MTGAALQRTLQSVARVDPAIAARVRRDLDGKTKPRGSLGRLEDLACQIAAIRGGVPHGPLHKTVVVMAADHGVATEGVSAYPQVVTGQMVHNFAMGGAAINVLARQASAQVVVVDMGVSHPVATPNATLSGVELRHASIAAGTASFVDGPAMTPAQTVQAVEYGIGLADELVDAGTEVIALGEMGIGNTTAASALTVALSRRGAAEVTGLGTGIAPTTLERKVRLIERALERHRPAIDTAWGALERLGGFEIAGLCGVTLGAAARRVPVLMDGFIASVAALCAVRMCPAAADFLIASHASTEPGHRIVLAELGKAPLLTLGLRLGEGSGAALALPLCDAAMAIVRDMATFESADVSTADGGAA